MWPNGFKVVELASKQPLWRLLAYIEEATKQTGPEAIKTAREWVDTGKHFVFDAEPKPDHTGLTLTPAGDLESRKNGVRIAPTVTEDTSKAMTMYLRGAMNADEAALVAGISGSDFMCLYSLLGLGAPAVLNS